jgi:hypothetical protein
MFDSTLTLSTKAHQHSQLIDSAQNIVSDSSIVTAQLTAAKKRTLGLLVDSALRHTLQCIKADQEEEEQEQQVQQR